MATRDEKMKMLITTLGFDEAMKLAPGLTDDATGNSDADKIAAEQAALANAASTNPFKKGENFSLKKQGELYKNPKTRDLAIRLAKAAGITLKDNPLQNDLNAHFAPVRYGS